MVTIYLIQWKKLIKNPFLILLFSGLTFLMVNVIAGSQGSQTVPVQVFSDSLSDEQISERINRLNEDDSFEFTAADSNEIEQAIRMDDYGFAVELSEYNYSFLIGRESETLPIVEQYLNRTYRELNTITEVEAQFPDTEIDIQTIVNVETNALSKIGSSIRNLSVMIGMTLYFSIYSILFMMITLFEEKRFGTWNRLIFSPVTKTRLYLGHLLFYVTIGILQVTFLIFVLGNMLSIELPPNVLPVILIILTFILSIVSLGILLTALAKTTAALQVTIPIVATAMAMIGGAFWPLDFVSNPVLEFLAEFMPIKHAIYGIIEIVLQQHSFLDALQPIGYLLLMSILFMGIGINLMERPSQYTN